MSNLSTAVQVRLRNASLRRPWIQLLDRLQYPLLSLWIVAGDPHDEGETDLGTCCRDRQ